MIGKGKVNPVLN